MEDFLINVTEIEELQTIGNVDQLEIIFTKAKRTITGGRSVLLVRGSIDKKFDELTTEQELVLYKETVYKYL